MPNIKPVSDLKDYSTVLKEVSYGNPVYLTKDGRGDYAIVTMQELDELTALKGLFGALEKGEASARKSGWVSYEAAREALGV